MSIYDSLNNKQREAVFETEGPLLLLAGAGSGKTRVLVHRIACLIEEKGVSPWNIMAITFTNKAAKEMRERVDNMIGYGADSIWVSTFHSSCVRILRRDIDRLGYMKNFSIYDTDDMKRTIKDVVKSLKYDAKQFPERQMMNLISDAKNRYVSVEEFTSTAKGDFRLEKVAKVYEEYQKKLKVSNALDFDDLLFKTVELFENNPDVLNYWQERFKYIMVDEYQDTNAVQFRLIKNLASKYRNLCVVGDDDQSIYGFRGADIRNILDFEKYFTDAKIIKLEQNYRSTSNILNAANSVIRNNQDRKPKTLWTENEEGEKVTFKQFDDAYKEAEYTVDCIRRAVRNGAKYNDIAILNRTNAQSRIYEEKFIYASIPYKIVGGVNFYARMEIRDIVSYLKVISNPADDQALKRIINVPRRGIGQSSVEKMVDYGTANGLCLLDSCLDGSALGTLSKAAATKVSKFAEWICELIDAKDSISISELYDRILTESGYSSSLELEGTDEAKGRIENLEELKSKIAQYEEDEAEPSLDAFLSEVALIADIDSLAGDDAVTVMTIHSAKGLEFPTVFMGGMEDGVFPSYMSINSDDGSGVSEERRLCYVAITRAREKLYMTAAKQRMLNGKTQYNSVSRFVNEIDKEYIDGDKKSSLSSYGLTDDDIYTGSISSFRSSYASASRSDTGASIGYSKGFAGMKTYGETQAAGNLSELDYKVGDTVRHIKFGTGVVISIEAAGKDYEVVVDYEKYGEKRSFASFARLKKVD